MTDKEVEAKFADMEVAFEILRQAVIVNNHHIAMVIESGVTSTSPDGINKHSDMLKNQMDALTPVEKETK